MKFSRLLRKPTGDQRSSLRHVPAVCSNIASVHRQAIHAAGATTPSHTSASTPTEYVNLFENPVDHHEVDEREKYDTLPRPKSVLVHDPHVPSYAASARQPQDQLDIEVRATVWANVAMHIAFILKSNIICRTELWKYFFSQPDDKP